jgi:hypothetical protein
MGVPYTFSTASQSIPLAQLDSNFATPITFGQTTAALGQTVTTITGLTLANVNITSGNVVANASGNITFGNTTVGLGNSSPNIGNLTLLNANVSTGVIGPTVTATIQATTDNSSNVATTSFVSSAISASKTLGTLQATTSGTSINFTGIPATAKRITVIFSGVSTNGSSPVIVQLGTGGGLTTSGYLSFILFNGGVTSATNGFVVPGVGANDTRSGLMIITTSGSNNWSEINGNSVGTNGGAGGGGVTLSGTLTQLSITTVNGTDTFDAGSVNILYE